MANRHPSIVPYETFEASDGFFNIGVTNESLWHRFCEALELEGLESDPLYASVALRVKNYDTLRPKLAALFQERPAAYWLECLRKAGVPCGEVRTVAQALEEPQLRAREMILELDHPRSGPIRMTGSPIKMSAVDSLRATPPPMHGQHNREVYCGLLELSDEELEDLRREEVI
jgi:crotonobetainyl-CoA:carnitine CoA-transferase CaiB-like acyl-CoA transferase